MQAGKYVSCVDVRQHRKKINYDFVQILLCQLSECHHLLGMWLSEKLVFHFLQFMLLPEAIFSDVKERRVCQKDAMNIDDTTHYLGVELQVFDAGDQ